MAVTFATGFEAQSDAADLGVSGTAAYSTTQHRTGAASFRCNPASGGFAYFSPGAISTGWLHFGLYIASLPTVDRTILGGALAGWCNVKLTSGGSLAYYVNTTLIGTASSALSTGGWYWIGVKTDPAGTVALIQINGVTALTANATAAGGFGNSIGPGTDTDLSAIDIYFDDIIIDGAGFLAPSNVGLAVPISDNAVGTGWTLGTGTAISANSGSTAVKNKPPVGVADLTAGSNVKQIRNATSNASVNYDANLQTYTTVGVGASDTVIAVQPVIATAAPASTSAKAGTVGLSANPVITNIALGAGGTAGAFWSGVAGGAYPTGWKVSFGTLTTSPTVTKGSSPVMRVTQVTASTEIADVCFMGLVVAWTPAATGVTSLPTAGSLTLSGATPVVATPVLSQPTVGSLTLSGATPVVIIGTVALPSAASLTLSGATPVVTAIGTASRQPTAASLTLAGATPVVALVASEQPTAGSLALAGATPVVLVPRVAAPTAASLALSGATPAVLTPALSQPTAASLTLTGATPTVTAVGTALSQPTAGSLTLSGAIPVVALTVVSQPTAGSLTLAGATPTVTAVGTASRQPTAGSLSLTGAVPSVALTASEQPTAGALVLAGATPAVVLPAASQPTAASLSLSGATPAVVTPVVSQPGAGSLTLAGATPTVTAVGTALSQPTAASLSLSGAVPVVIVSSPGVFQPTAGHIVLSGATPAVALVVSTQPTAGSLALSGAVPAVVLPVVCQPSAASLALTGATPVVTVESGVASQPFAASLTLAGAIPVVTAIGTASPQPSAAALALAGGTPLVALTASEQPMAASLVLSGAVPAISLPVVSQPTDAVLTLTGDTPIVTAVETVNAIVTAGVLTLTGVPPRVIAVDPITSQPNAAALTLNGVPVIVTVAVWLGLATFYLQNRLQPVATGNVIRKDGVGNFVVTSFDGLVFQQIINFGEVDVQVTENTPTSLTLFVPSEYPVTTVVVHGSWTGGISIP